MRLPVKHIARLLDKASDKQAENTAWELYVSVYPKMTKETFVPFEKFYNPGKIQKEEVKTEEEILTNVKKILDSFNGGEKNRNI